MMDSKASQLISSVNSETVENRFFVAEAHNMRFVSLRALSVSVSDRDVMIASSSEGRVDKAIFLQWKMSFSIRKGGVRPSYRTSIPIC